MTPRDYLSFSQMKLIERNPEEYRRIYFQAGESRSNKYTRFGTEFHKAIELDVPTDDVKLEMVRLFLPHYPDREFTLRGSLKIGREELRLLARPDGWNPQKLAVGDYKSGKLWTQKMADDSDQLTFDALVVYCMTKKIPALAIHWAETAEDLEGDVFLTGRVETFPTTRTMLDLMKMGARARRAWAAITKMAQEEWEKVL